MLGRQYSEVPQDKYTHILEMQQYINISPYCDTLGSGVTVILY